MSKPSFLKHKKNFPKKQENAEGKETQNEVGQEENQEKDVQLLFKSNVEQTAEDNKQ